jgi:hypothetical protein
MAKAAKSINQDDVNMTMKEMRTVGKKYEEIEDTLTVRI